MKNVAKRLFSRFRSKGGNKADEQIVLGTVDARQGGRQIGSIYVLLISTALAIVSMAIVWWVALRAP